MTTESAATLVEQVFRGGGEMGARTRAFDWFSTPLGAVDGWPLSLRTAVGMLLATRHPMFLWWGPQLIQFYNDGYRRSLGPDRHPSALGQRGVECWPEIWPTIGPQIQAVMERGEATWHEDQYLPIMRGDRLEDVYWSYSYSPVPDDAGGVGGVLVTVQETTKRVLSDRRRRLLHQLAARLGEAGSETEVCAIANSVLAAEPDDVAFALLYLPGAGAGVAELACAAGLDAGHPAAPATIRRAEDAPWPVARALEDAGAVPVTELASRGLVIHRASWPEPVREALLLPLDAKAGGQAAGGVVVAGINPRLPLDEEYRSFLEQVVREIAGALANARNRQQERLAWRAAERAELRLARVYAQAPVAMTVLRGPEHVFEIANARYLAIVAGERSIVGLPIRTALPELAGQGIYELLDETFATGAPCYVHERSLMVARGPDGVPEAVIYNWVYEPLVDEHGLVEGIACVATEVTEFVRAREAAEQAAAERDAERRQLLTVLEQSPVAIVIAEAPSGRILFQNRLVAKIFGQPRLPDYLGALGPEWRRFDAQGRLLAPTEGPLGRALLGETIDGDLLEAEGPDGRRISISATAAPVRNADGSIIAAVSIFGDVTSAQRTERQLRDAQRLQTVGTLAGGVAHEVNNQMTGVLGFGDFVLRALGPDHPQAADMRIVLQAAERAAHVSQQLLAFTRQQVSQPRIIDLHAIAAGLWPILKQLLGTDKTLEIDAGAATRRVSADPSQVEQVLINLVANARDATPTGGRVTIRVENIELTELRSGERKGVTMVPGPYVLLSVADTGRGMDGATLARIFEPFFTTKPVGQGTGLGLSMVYGIVKQHGGYIWADSTPGGGTSLKLYWPAAPAAARQESGAGAEATGSEPRSPAGRKATILVVEDEPTVRALAVRSLEAHGFTVVAAEHGSDALELVERSAPALDLVVTDVIMPRMNGRQLSDALATIRPGLPVLFMSGYTGEDVVLRELVPACSVLPS
jgi:PAS domain S-box-containing protein